MTLRTIGGHALGMPLVSLLALLAGGCQSYERQPLDMAAHRAAFLARTPEHAEVRAFVAGLRALPDDGAFDPTDGVSCAEAEIIALVFNADLRLARLRAGVTRATAENSGLWEDPTIGVDLTRIIESTPEPWKVFATVGITLPISGRLEIEKQRASVEHGAELARVAQREWAVRMAVRRAWSEWSGLDAQLTTTRDFIEGIEQVLSVVDKMEQAGELARIEARLFRIEKTTTLSDLALLESRTIESGLRLRALMGISPDATVAFQARGIGPGGLSHCAPDTDAARSALEARNPSMLVALAEYEAAEKSLELEVRKQYPDLHIGPGYGREDGQDQLLLGLSLPIPIFNRNRQAIAETRARRELARASAETTLEQLLTSLRAAEVRQRAAAQRRQSLESEIVPLVEAQYADARQIAQLWEVNTLVLLESLTRQQEAKLRLIEAVRDESLAAIDVEEILGPPPTTAQTTPPLPPQPASEPGGETQ